jgi:glycine betaine/choline ABC-type transport system substrate-binding protein
MNGTEQRLLGEIVAQHLEKRLEGVLIRRQFGIGDTPILYQALLSRQIDLYPEYTGAIIAEILNEEVPSNPEVAFERARLEMARRAQFDLIGPLGFDARFAAVVRAAGAQGVSTLSQAAAGSRKWTQGVPLEFQARSDGLPKLNAYRLPLSAAPRPMQPEQLFPALEKGEIDMLVAPKTDSHLTDTRWKVLEDDQQLATPQEVALMVNQERIKEYPKLKAALEELKGRLSLETMRRLNAQVDRDERPVAEVAAEFLKTSGL